MDKDQDWLRPTDRRQKLSDARSPKARGGQLEGTKYQAGAQRCSQGEAGPAESQRARRGPKGTWGQGGAGGENATEEVRSQAGEEVEEKQQRGLQCAGRSLGPGSALRVTTPSGNWSMLQLRREKCGAWWTCPGSWGSDRWGTGTSIPWQEEAEGPGPRRVGAGAHLLACSPGKLISRQGCRRTGSRLEAMPGGQQKHLQEPKGLDLSQRPLQTSPIPDVFKTVGLQSPAPPLRHVPRVELLGNPFLSPCKPLCCPQSAGNTAPLGSHSIKGWLSQLPAPPTQ